MSVQRTILVTGARGYLGGRICQGILGRSDLGLIGTSRQDRPPASWPGGKLVRWDLASKAAPPAGLLSRVDAVVHLAASDQSTSASNIDRALDVDVRGGVRLLQAAIAAGVARFIYMSTAHVYGAPLVGRIDEKTVPRPAHPYSTTHRAMEDFVLAAHDKRQVIGTVLRLSNGIGAPASADISQWHLVGNDLCRQAVTTGTLVLSSSGEQWRDFIPLDDIAAAVLHMIDLPSDMVGDGLFNLGSGVPLRVLDVAEQVAARAEALFGSRPAIRRGSGQPAAPIDYRVDKIAATGFRPEADIDRAVDATLQFCSRHFQTSREQAARKN